MTNSTSYPRLAFCSAVTPATSEHYQQLKQAGIDTVSVCLSLSGCNHYKYATIHTNLARQAEMTTHAYMMTDLQDPTGDVISFSKKLIALGYPATSKVTIWVSSQIRVQQREERIQKIIDLMSNYHKRDCIDVAFFKRDIKLYNLSKLPKLMNLTIINTEKVQSSGVDIAGTWAYTDDFEGQVQTLAYDLYGYYTEDSYQLSLVDTDYIVRKGDTWHSISMRHGIPIADLLALNRALITDKVFAGQVVRIA